MALLAHAIVTWDILKAMLPELVDEDQEFYEGLINTASQILESEFGGQIVSREKTVFLDGAGRAGLLLPDYPFTGAVSVWVDSSREFLPSSELTGLIPYEEDGILYHQTVWPTGRKNIKVTYSPGWNPVPTDIQDACMRLVVKGAADYRNKRMGIKSSTGMDGQRTEYDIGIPTDVYKVIARYKKEAV